MMKVNENTYWLAISSLKNWKIKRINQLIELVYNNLQKDIEDLFNIDEDILKKDFQFLKEEIQSFVEAKKQLPNLTFISEQILNEGFEIIPIVSPDYPSILKQKLSDSAPPVLYIKGKINLLHKEASAIIGSRDASQIALEFTENVAKKLVKDGKVIVSGGAKGVDQKALESAMVNDGESILVLPQGILTFSYGFKKYYEFITSGKLLVVSAFFPKSPWDVSLAMIRNQYIIGLAKEIYVAESGFNGGTWEGANLALRRKEKVYVRQPDKNEKNANLILIEKGAIPLNFFGEIISTDKDAKLTDSIVAEPTPKYSEEDELKEKIINYLKDKSCSITQIIKDLNLNITRKKLQRIIIKIPEIRIVEGRPKKYTCMKLDESEQLNLFKTTN